MRSISTMTRHPFASRVTFSGPWGILKVTVGTPVYPNQESSSLSRKRSKSDNRKRKRKGMNQTTEVALAISTEMCVLDSAYRLSSKSGRSPWLIGKGGRCGS